jgi:hypothetical protein
MNRPVYRLGDYQFRSKAEAQRVVSDLLNHAPLNLPLLETPLLVALLAKHPHGTEKIGCGVRSIDIREHLWRDRFRQRGFYIVRTDGSTVAFSYLACFRDHDRQAQLDVFEACRHAVDPSVLLFRGEAFASGYAPCAETGRALQSEEAHIDHAEPWPFRRLVSAWLATLPEPPAVDPSDDLVTRFADPEVTRAFRAFHDARAVLRVLDKRVNMAWRRRQAA